MPSTSPACSTSRVHSMSSFSMNGSPTCTLGRLVGPPSSKVSDASTDDAADAVAAGPRAVQHDEVADALGAREVDVLVPHRADAERVDQRVALVATGRRRPRRRCWAGRGSCRSRRRRRRRRAARGGCRGASSGAEAQRVHHGDRAGAHRDDVAHDAADAGGRALVGLDVGRVVVRLDLEGDRPAVADVDDAGVLADADEQGVGLAASCRRTACRCTLLDL